MKDIKIGLAGFGTVGRGTWELLEKNKKKIEKSSKIVDLLHFVLFVARLVVFQSVLMKFHNIR